MQQQFPSGAEKFIDDSLKEGPPCISAITEIELLSWKTTHEKDLLVLQNFIRDTLVVELERLIKLKTADIRKSNKIKLPEAIIAATALIYDLTLISRNLQDFKNIKGIQIFDPHSL